MQLVHSHDIDLFLFADCNLSYIISQLSFGILLTPSSQINSACVGVRVWRERLDNNIEKEREYRGEIKKKKKCFYPLSESSQFTVKTEMV